MGRRLRALTGGPAPERRPLALLIARPRLARWLVGAAAAGCVLVVAGPVGALVAAVYAVLAVGLLQARELRARRSMAESGALDAVVALAADLRAGQPPDVALHAVLGAVDPVSGTPSPVVALVARRLRAAVRVAEVAGAPLADLLDRLDADLRARSRAAAEGAAQAAGATATSWLLTVLPLAGVGLGYALGVDPGRQLLRTPLGAACVVLALALQLAGLTWVGRIARSVAGVAG